MNTNIFTRWFKLIPIGIIALFLLACERDLDDLSPIDFPANPYVFTDGFSSGLNYAAFGNSVPTAFEVDFKVTYNNTAASMRFDVPNAADPRGSYAGGTFFTETGRNLTGFNALTFFAKATQSATLNVIGFGNDLGESKFQASISDLTITTNWQKYIIPIPDPSKLTQEKGMFFYSVGPENGKGFSFWIDELKFEKLGTIAHPQHLILNGQNQQETSFAGVSKTIGGLQTSYNMPTGINQNINVTPAYFTFVSSDPSVATVNEKGEVAIVGGPALAVITATMNGVEAKGSLTIDSKGPYQHAPTPTHPPGNVISIFSDAYPNRPVEYYNGYWAPWQTTLSADFVVSGDNVLHYTDFNFVGIQFSSPTINATAMTHFHVNIYFPNPVAAGAQFKIQLVDFGPNDAFGGGDDSNHTLTFTGATLQSQNWITFDIPLSNFTGLIRRGNLAQIIFEGTNISSFYADNIYFHK